MRYETKNLRGMVLFGLGADVAINSIIDLPKLCQWVGNFDFNKNTFIATYISTCSPLHYEPTKQGLPPTFVFSNSFYVRPNHTVSHQASVMFKNISNKKPLTVNKIIVFSGDKPLTTIVHSNVGS